MIKILLNLFIVQFIFAGIINAQDDEFEFFVVDSYVAVEKPYTFHLMFFTSEVSRTKIIIADKYEYEISDDLKEEHNIVIDISKLNFDSLYIPYKLIAIDAEGNIHESEMNEFELPEMIKLPKNSYSNIFTTVCFGSVFFLTPSPGIMFDESDTYFTLSKELPLFSYYGVGYNYPTGYFGVEYSFTFGSKTNNYFRVGYKHLFQPGIIEFVSAGINYTTDFNGFNGVSPEVSFGLFNLYDAFTLYARYRYNVKPGNSGSSFHEIGLGLYSNFFSINL